MHASGGLLRSTDGIGHKLGQEIADGSSFGAGALLYGAGQVGRQPSGKLNGAVLFVTNVFHRTGLTRAGPGRNAVKGLPGVSR
jgi:hypothetical protein